MKYIVGNWKMHPRTLDEAKVIVAEAKKAAIPAQKKQVQTIVCVPTPFLAALAGRSSALVFGAQDCSSFIEGPHTGEVAPAQIASAGAKVVILGHSERRALGETDAMVAAKVSAAVRSTLQVVLCIGEAQRDPGGDFFTAVARQLHASLLGFPTRHLPQLMVAYEPVWAIGAQATGAASPRDHAEMAMLIRRVLGELFGKQKAFNVPILYGGSVDAKNARSFLDVGADGLLVGRASNDPVKFSDIIHSAYDHA